MHTTPQPGKWFPRFARARTLLIGLLAAAGLAATEGGPQQPGPKTPDAPAAPAPSRVVYLGGKLSDEAVISLGAAVAARPGALLLLDSRALRPYLQHFLTAYRAEKVVPVGTFDESQAELAEKLGVDVEPAIPWPEASGPCPLWQEPTKVRPASVIVCPAQPREQLLRAAHLAALEGAVLWVDSRACRDKLQPYLAQSGIRQVVLVGKTPVEITNVWVSRLEGPQQVEAACLRQLSAAGAVETAVVTNPADGESGMSPLAPYLAATKRAALLFSDRAGANVPEVVQRATRDRALADLDSIILLADLKAIPVWQRPNPIPGDKDKLIDMEPLTPTGEQPVTYAVGRLFHDNRPVVPLMLARQRLLAQTKGPRRALVASNPGGGLSLLETFSRNTAAELRNVGYEVTDLFARDLTADVLRKQMPGNEVILWEGHHNTLVKEWGFTGWDEPLSPAFVFLQSCLALQPEKVQPLLSRGALAVLGTSTRTYSGSGGAFSLAYLDALLYEGQSLGGSLRQAKNFLTAYAQLKQKRLGDSASRVGANTRASWAFTLWGDPTFRLPLPQRHVRSLAEVRHAVKGNTVVVELPGELHGKVRSDRFSVQMPPNSRLAGLIRKNGDESTHPLVPFLFAEVGLPAGRDGSTPRLSSRLPANRWTFLWDARRRTGYLLVAPRSLDRGELRFRVDWSGGASVAGRTAKGGGS